MSDIDLRKVFISYIDIGAPTEVRRRRLRKYYHFDCLCDRCTGIKLSWVISEPFNQNLSDILIQKHSIVETLKTMSKGKDKDYFSSIRCQKCSGRPVQVLKDKSAIACSFCGQKVERLTIEEYFEVKAAVEKVLDMVQIPADAAPQCMELMTGLFYPYDLTYIAVCSRAMTDCLLQNRMVQALEFANILQGVLRKFVKGSPAHVELIQRIMRILSELGRKSELDTLVQTALVDTYNNTELCTNILKTRDKLYTEYFDNKEF